MVKKEIPESTAKEYFKKVLNIKPDETVKTIINYLEKSGFGSQYYRFEPTLARSFSYSQGPIWEIVIGDYTVGSVGGGERYDGMMERLTGLKIAGTGVAFGFDRTVEAADQLGLLTVFTDETTDATLKSAQALRDNKINTEIYPEIAKLDKQLKYADKKGIPYVVIIGPEEIKENKVVLKNLKTKEQIKTSVENLISLVK